MLPDPISVTYDGSAVSLPRASGPQTSGSKAANNTSYVSADGAVFAQSEHTTLPGGYRESGLRIGIRDTDGAYVSVGLRVVHTDNTLDLTIEKVRSALNTYLSDATLSRIVNGEG